MAEVRIRFQSSVIIFRPQATFLYLVEKMLTISICNKYGPYIFRGLTYLTESCGGNGRNSLTPTDVRGNGVEVELNQFTGGWTCRDNTFLEMG